MRRFSRIKFWSALFLSVTFLLATKNSEELEGNAPKLINTDHPASYSFIEKEKWTKQKALNKITTTPKGVVLNHPQYQVDFTDNELAVKPTSGAPVWHWGATDLTNNNRPYYDKLNNKIVYGRKFWKEEYILKEKSIEQQFIISDPIATDQPTIKVEGRIRSDGLFSTTNNGWSWKNKYGEVTLGRVYVYDGSGREIQAAMNVTADRSTIEIETKDLEGASYPITIDPEIGSNDFRISAVGTDGDNTNFSAFNPSVAHCPTSDPGTYPGGIYLVVWEGSVTGESEIYGQFIDGDTGNLLDANPDPQKTEIKISNMNNSTDPNYDALKPDVVSTGTKFLVVWYGDDTVDGEFEIYGQLLDPITRTEDGSDFKISNMGTAGDIAFGAFDPSVAFNNTNDKFLVVWYGDNSVDNDFEIYSKEVPESGVVTPGQSVISATGFGAFGPRVVWNSSLSTNEYLVTFYSDNAVDNENEIFIHRVDGASGSELGIDIRISDMGPNGSTTYNALNPSISCNPSGGTRSYLITWQGDDDTAPLVDEENEIFGQFITSAGAETGSDFRISDMGPNGNINYDAAFPKVSFDPFLQQFLVVWHGDDDAGTIDGENEVFGQLINSSTGAEIGSDFRLTDAGGLGNTTYSAAAAAVAYNPGDREHLVVWRGDDNSVAGMVDNEFEIWGQRFAELSPEPTAQPTAPVFSSTTSSSFTVNFTAASGSPDGYLVLRKSGSTPTDIPTDQQVYAVNDMIVTSTVAFVGSLLTFNQSGLNEGTTYHYDFFSYSGVNSSTNYLTASPLEGNVTTLATEPSAHAATFSATQAGTNQINLAFSAASTIANADGYIILRRQDGTNPTASGIADAAVAPATPVAGTTLIATITNTATTSFNDTGVSPGIQYNYVIIPYGYNGSNALSYNFRTAATIPAATATTLSLEPSAHAATFTAVPSGTSQINLSFSAANTITNAAGYIILRRQDGANPTATGITDAAAAPGTPTTGTTLVTTITNTALTSFNDAVSAGTQYNYAIIPYGYNGSNALSYNFRTAATIPTANATTLSLEPLAHPAMFTATTGGSNQINLTFSAASTITNAVGYIILRRQDLSNPTSAGITDATATSATPTAGTTLVTTITNTATTSFNDTGVSPGAQYNYAIFAYGYNGSNTLTYNYLLTAGMTANAFTLSLEPASHAASFTASPAGTTQINLTFSAASTITNAAGYIILRRQDGTNPATTGVTDGATTPGTPTAGTTLVTTITNTATTTFNDAVSSGTQYNYSIIPYGYNGSNAQTYNYRTAATVPTANATTLSLEPLAHPASFTAATGGSNQINLTFSAANTITNAAGYIILRRQDLSNPTNAGIADATATPATPTAGTTLVTSITNTASTSFNDTGVSPGIQYNYTILPYGYNGTNALTYNYLLTTGISANAFTLSAEPAAHSATFTASQAGTGQINLAFSAASTIANAGGYIILRRQDGTNPTVTGITDGATAPGTPAPGTTLITTITNTSTTTFNDAVSVGTQYNYAIIPYGYNGSNAQTYNFRTAATVPVATATTLSLEPTGHPTFDATPSGTDQINLTFSPLSSITNAVGYIILKRTDGNDPTSAGVTDATAPLANPTPGTTLLTTITNTSTTTFNDGGLTSGTQHNYIIIVYGYSGTNALTYNYRTAATIPVASTITQPVPPTAETLTDVDVAQTSFTARWNNVNGATLYRLDVSTDDFASFVGAYNSLSVTQNSETVTGLTAGTIYKYRVRAENANGLLSDYSNVVPVTTDPPSGGPLPLAISPTISFSDLGPGQTFVKVSVDVTGGTGTKIVQLFRKGITSPLAHDPLLMTQDGNTFSVNVQQADFDDLGVEFFIRASDASANPPEESTKRYIYKSFAISTQAIPSIVRHGGTQKSYQMISIPFKLSDDIILSVFGEELGDFDITKWRLVRWQSNTQAYVDPPSFTKIEQGKSYWFNSVEEVNVLIPAGTTKTNPENHQSSPFKMNLLAGWNQIANPYLFDIDWDDVLAANGSPAVGNYNVFNSSELGFNETNSLKPYEGGFVFADNTITLDIPVSLKNTAGGRKPKARLNQNIDGGEWLLPLTLVQGDVKNTQGGIGMHPQANTSKDRWDDVTVPRFVQYLESNFYHPEFFWPRFSKDIVPTTEEHEWALSIESNGQGTIELQWDAQAIMNAQSNLFLYDEEEGRLIDMKVQPSFTISERGRKDLKLIYTHKGEYIPGNTLLGNAWPNPANTEVNIPVILSGTVTAYNVEVDVYDLKGVKQKSVVAGEYQAGIHTAHWDIKDANGNDVANGMYIVKLKVNGRYLPDYSKVIVNRNH